MKIILFVVVFFMVVLFVSVGIVIIFILDDMIVEKINGDCLFGVVML